MSNFSQNIKGTRYAIIWSAIESSISNVLRIVISIILARLLFPEDFGIMALLTLFLGIAGLFVNAGLSAALIQNQNTTHLDESTVFWFNITAALIITLILFFSAPLIAKFFNMPVLTILTKILACNIFIGSLGSIHHTLMIKNLEFKSIMKIGVTSTIISGVVGIYFAIKSYGVWALVAQSVTGTILVTIMAWLYSSWRPLIKFSKSSFCVLFHYGGYIFAASLLQVIYQHGYTLLIGKYFGVRDLGIFIRAENTQKMIVVIPISIVSRVTFPLYSSIHNDSIKLRSMVRKSIRSVTLITSPLMFGLAMLATPFIEIIFGKHWLLSAPILQVLCIVGLLLPIHDVNVNILKAQGHADLNFRINIIKKLTGIIFLIIGSFYGVMGVAWGCVIQSLMALVINGHYSNKFLDYGTTKQIKDCFPSFMLSMLMAIFVGLLNAIIVVESVFELLTVVLSGALFYLASNILFKNMAYREAIVFLSNRDN